jgi:hypothetical protein
MQKVASYAFMLHMTQKQGAECQVQIVRLRERHSIGLALIIVYLAKFVTIVVFGSAKILEMLLSNMKRKMVYVA